MLADGPAAAVRGGAPRADRPAQVVGRPTFELGPAGTHQGGMMRVARAGLRDAKDVRVEPARPGGAHATRVGRVAHLDTVDAAFRTAPRERTEGTLADREREVGERVGHDRHTAPG